MERTNIDDLQNKVENEGMTEAGRLGANEFNRLVTAVRENQGSALSVSLNGGEPEHPDKEGNINLTIALGDYEQVLTVMYDGKEITGGDSILSADGDVTLKVQYKESSVTQGSGGTVTYAPTGQIVTLTAYGVSATGSMSTLFSRSLQSVGHESAVFTDIPLKDYLTNGEQSIQFRVTNTINSNPIQQLLTIIKANLELRIEEDAAWYRDAKIGGATSLTARYIVLGAVEKSLHVKFIGESSEETVEVTNITSNSPTEIITATFTESTARNIGFFSSNGVRSVEAWITCSTKSASGEIIDTVESNHITNQIIVVADAESAQPMIALQSKLTIMPNYETETIFSWNMYHPQLGDGQTANVEFTLANQAHSTVWLTQIVENVANNTLLPFSQNVSIDASGDFIDVYIFAKVNGAEVGGAELAHFQVDNTTDYSAVPNPDFYLNPGLRSNSESDPARIINSADGSLVSGCTFENMAWQDGVDGWIQGSDGRRFLRIASGGKVTIPYNVYSQFTTNSRHFLTIEVDFAARNITNEADPVLTIGNRNFVAPKGVYMKPLNGAFVTGTQTDWNNADISWQEGVRTHVVFNICHNYVISNPDRTRGTDQPATKTLALVRTYINGTINKEYSFDTSEASEINAGGDIVLGQSGFLLLPSEPTDWATNYGAYYTLNNGEYRAIEEVTAPTFAPNTYYKKIDSGCDLDIYCLRVYKDTNDKSNLNPTDVIKNKVSLLPTGAERAAFKAKNDLLQGGVISFAKAMAAGYNCLVWHGLPVNKGNANSQKRYGYAEIYRYNADGTLDVQHSGKLYGIEMKGQGTTAMGYPEWNIQFKEDKKTGLGHDEYKYKDNGVLRNVFVDDEGVIAYGKSTKKFGYKLDASVPTGKKLVGKINYASSMQSHKEGACNLYNDLYAAIIGSNNSVTNFGNGERVTVKEEPFLYFVQRTEGSDDSLKVFQGPMTFGPGKADKPTWGVADSDLMAGDSMLEGSLNNNPLGDTRVPFTDTGEITYSVSNEAFMYANTKNLNFSFGDTASLHDGQGAWEYVVQDTDEATDEVPTKAQVKLWQPIFNFLYLTNIGIKPWDTKVNGSHIEALNQAAQDDDFDYKSAYWINGNPDNGNAYKRFDLYRCRYTKSGNTESREFIPAGLRLVQGSKTYTNYNCLYAISDGDTTKPQAYTEEDKWYDTNNSGARALTLNIKEDLEAALGVTIAISGVSADRLNTTFKNHLANLFARYVDSNLYLNKQSHLFHHEMMKLWAGTDNRSKNTYYRLNTTIDRPNMEMNDDDLDTIFKTNNAGIQSKPYYILEHDTDEEGRTYWDGQNNALNNTLEATYGRALGFSGDRQNTLQAMMRSILIAMQNLVTAGDTMPDGSAIPNTPMGCMDKYFFKIQKYFPSVVYNETARIRYEVPSTFYMSEQPAQAPLTQSLGDQYDSEREYVKRRLIMLAGYAGYEMDMLSFRDYLGAYTAEIVPHFWLYPMSKMGNPQDTPVKSNVRVPAGEKYTLSMGTAVSGNTIFLHFINELTDIGNIASWSNGQKSGDASSVINIASERLRSFKCYGDTPEAVKFPLSTVNLSDSTNIEEINCRNCATLSAFDKGIGKLMRLRTLDLRGTSVKNLGLPQTTSLTSVRLPHGFEVININKCPNVETLSIGDFSGLTRLVINAPVKFDTMEFVSGCYTYNKTLTENKITSLTLTDIDWSNCNYSLLTWLLTIPTLTITGRIHMKRDASGMVNFALKKKLIEKFGNVDSVQNALYIDYAQTALGSVKVSGDGYFDRVGEVKHYDLTPNFSAANTIRSYEWKIVGGSSGVDADDYVEIDAFGNVTCKQMGSEGDGGIKPSVTIQCEVTLVDNSVIVSDTIEIRCYFRQARLGDYVYHDGTWDNRLNTTKSVIGICVYCKKVVEENGEEWYDRRMVACNDVNSRPWGLYPAGDNATANGFVSNGDGALKYDLDKDPDHVAEADPFDVPMATNVPNVANVYANMEWMVDTDNPNTEYDDNDPQKLWKRYASNHPLGYLEPIALGQILKDDVVPNEGGYRADSKIPIGQYDTLAIIRHRNKVLEGTYYTDNKGTDTTSDDELVDFTQFRPNDTNKGENSLPNKMLAIARFAQDTLGLTEEMAQKYMQYLYPAASECFAYEPTVASGNVLNDKFKAHHWYLPSIGELARLCFLDRTCNPNVSFYDSSAKALFNDIFESATNAGKFTRTTSSYYYSSSECSSYAWLVSFYSVSVYGGSKYYPCKVRPFSAF